LARATVTPEDLALEDVPGLAYARADHGCNWDRRDCCVARWMRQGRAEPTLAFGRSRGVLS